MVLSIFHPHIEIPVILFTHFFQWLIIFWHLKKSNNFKALGLRSSQDFSTNLQFFTIFSMLMSFHHWNTFSLNFFYCILSTTGTITLSIRLCIFQYYIKFCTGIKISRTAQTFKTTPYRWNMILSLTEQKSVFIYPLIKIQFANCFVMNYLFLWWCYPNLYFFLFV